MERRRSWERGKKILVRCRTKKDSGIFRPGGDQITKYRDIASGPSQQRKVPRKEWELDEGMLNLMQKVWRWVEYHEFAAGAGKIKLKTGKEGTITCQNDCMKRKEMTDVEEEGKAATSGRPDMPRVQGGGRQEDQSECWGRNKTAYVQKLTPRPGLSSQRAHGNCPT